MNAITWVRPLASLSKSTLGKLVRCLQLAYCAASPRPPTKISVMLRVKNEEEFLYPAVKSIAKYVEEIVIVDNLSTDSTPAVIESLREEYPDKVACYEYRHEVGRLGKENYELMRRPFSRFSRHLSANYYNWCLARCTKPYVLKWDGDMIATDAFHHDLAEFRQSKTSVMWIKGVNVHPDLKHSVAAKQSDLESLQASLVAPTTLHNWLAPYTDYEPRLFPRAFARYDTGFWWTERLRSPFVDGGAIHPYAYIAEGVSYLHMKYCKRDPYASFSDDFKGVIAPNIGQGPRISAELAAIVTRWEVNRGGR